MLARVRCPFGVPTQIAKLTSSGLETTEPAGEVFGRVGGEEHLSLILQGDLEDVGVRFARFRGAASNYGTTDVVNGKRRRTNGRG